MHLMEWTIEWDVSMKMNRFQVIFHHIGADFSVVKDKSTHHLRTFIQALLGYQGLNQQSEDV